MTPEQLAHWNGIVARHSSCEADNGEPCEECATICAVAKHLERVTAERDAALDRLAAAEKDLNTAKCVIRDSDARAEHEIDRMFEMIEAMAKERDEARAERDAAITKNDEQSAIIDALSETLNDAVRERDNAQCQRDAAILTAHKMEEKYAIEQMKRIAAEAIIGAAQRQLDAAIALMVEGMEGAVPGGPYIREWILARIAERVALEAEI